MFGGSSIIVLTIHEITSLSIVPIPSNIWKNLPNVSLGSSKIGDSSLFITTPSLTMVTKPLGFGDSPIERNLQLVN